MNKQTKKQAKLTYVGVTILGGLLGDDVMLWTLAMVIGTPLCDYSRTLWQMGGFCATCITYQWRCFLKNDVRNQDYGCDQEGHEETPGAPVILPFLPQWLLLRDVFTLKTSSLYDTLRICTFFSTQVLLQLKMYANCTVLGNNLQGLKRHWSINTGLLTSFSASKPSHPFTDLSFTTPV